MLCRRVVFAERFLPDFSFNLYFFRSWAASELNFLLLETSMFRSGGWTLANDTVSPSNPGHIFFGGEREAAKLRGATPTGQGGAQHFVLCVRLGLGRVARLKPTGVIDYLPTWLLVCVCRGRGRQAIAAGAILYIILKGSIHIIARRRTR